MSSKRIVLTYDANEKQDGVGAQIQRILAIFALANFLKIDYFHSGVAEIAVHPLDPYQTKSEYRAFIERLNSYFELPGATRKIFVGAEMVTLHTLKQRDLWKLLLRRTSHNQTTFAVSIANPFLLVDLKPNMYGIVTEFFRPRFVERDNHLTAAGIVGVHYRQGVGGFVVQNGEKYPRQLPMWYFREAINHHLLSNGHSVELIKIFTDSPEKNVQFSPPRDQEYLWRNTPRFENHRVEVFASDLSELTQGLSCPSEIKSGGDVLETLIQMAQVETLILSKSSLSYVAAIIGIQKVVYYPKGFWHPPLPGWKVITIT